MSLLRVLSLVTVALLALPANASAARERPLDPMAFVQAALVCRNIPPTIAAAQQRVVQQGWSRRGEPRTDNHGNPMYLFTRGELLLTLSPSPVQDASGTRCGITGPIERGVPWVILLGAAVEALGRGPRETNAEHANWMLDDQYAQLAYQPESRDPDPVMVFAPRRLVAGEAVVPTGEGYPLEEVLDAARALCGQAPKASDVDRAVPTGWELFEPARDTRFGRYVASNRRFGPDFEVTLRPLRATIAGRQLEALVAGIRFQDGDEGGSCEVYDYEAPIAFSEERLARWAGRTPTRIRDIRADVAILEGREFEADRAAARDGYIAIWNPGLEPVNSSSEVSLMQTLRYTAFTNDVP